MDLKTLNNIAVRLGELVLPRDREELLAIIKERIVGALQESDDEADHQAANNILHLANNKKFRQLKSDLKYCASQWRSRVLDVIRNWVPSQNNNTGEVLEFARRYLAFADLLQAVAEQVARLAP